MLKRTSIDGVEPVTVDEAKKHCYITASDSTTATLIDTFIKASRNYGENYTWRTLIDSTYELYMDEFPSMTLRNIIELPRSPVVSVTSVEYVDGDGNTQTVDSSNYRVDTVSEPARIEPVDGFTWPNTNDQVNAVTITYTAGYGDEGGSSTVPDDIKTALLMHIKYLYDNRDAHVLVHRSGAEFTSSPRGTDFILDQYSLRSP
jgi:uncharacterized phiE125 gp8 family phage protein